MREAEAWLVTGTDTGVGKTHVACAIARALRAEGRVVAVRKPAETGCAERDGVLYPEDASRLRSAAGSSEALEAICPVRLAEPLAPHVAAVRAGVAIDPAALVESCRVARSSADVLLVEGAGGLLVPLAHCYTFADLAADIGARVIVVVGARLGAINHARLTIEAARNRRLAVAGYVVNHYQPTTDLASVTLAETLRELLDSPCLAEVAFGENPEARLAGLITAQTPGVS
jgi:dethiobiotin synthetase